MSSQGAGRQGIKYPPGTLPVKSTTEGDSTQLYETPSNESDYPDSDSEAGERDYGDDSDDQMTEQPPSASRRRSSLFGTEYSQSSDDEMEDEEDEEDEEEGDGNSPVVARSSIENDEDDADDNVYEDYEQQVPSDNEDSPVATPGKIHSALTFPTTPGARAPTSPIASAYSENDNDDTHDEQSPGGGPVADIANEGGVELTPEQFDFINSLDLTRFNGLETDGTGVPLAINTQGLGPFFGGGHSHSSSNLSLQDLGVMGNVFGKPGGMGFTEETDLTTPATDQSACFSYPDFDPNIGDNLSRGSFPTSPTLTRQNSRVIKPKHKKTDPAKQAYLKALQEELAKRESSFLKKVAALRNTQQDMNELKERIAEIEGHK